jgi:hypothetical protein
VLGGPIERSEEFVDCDEVEAMLDAPDHALKMDAIQARLHVDYPKGPGSLVGCTPMPYSISVSVSNYQARGTPAKAPGRW